MLFSAGDGEGENENVELIASGEGGSGGDGDGPRGSQRMTTPYMTKVRFASVTDILRKWRVI